MNPDRLAAAVAQGHEDAVQAWPQEDDSAAEVLRRHRIMTGETWEGGYFTYCSCGAENVVGSAHQSKMLAAAGVLATPTPVSPPAGEDVERVARAIFAARLADGDYPEGTGAWETVDEDWRESCRVLARAALSARPVEHEACREERMHLLTQLASPPPGWSTLGTHVDQPDVRLEFWGDDGGGVPIWERPVQAQEGLPCDGGCSVETGGPAEDCSRHGRPIREVWDALATVQAREAAALARAEAAEAERGALRAKVRRAVNQYVTFEGPGHRVAALAYSEAMSHLRALLDGDSEGREARQPVAQEGEDPLRVEVRRLLAEFDDYDKRREITLGYIESRLRPLVPVETGGEGK